MVKSKENDIQEVVAGRGAPIFKKPASLLEINAKLMPSTIMWLGVLGLLGWLVSWQFIHIVTPDERQKFVPGAIEVIFKIFSLVADGEFANHVLKSLFRIYVSFGAACLVAIPIGLLMGTSASAKALLNPTIGAFRYLPAASFVPLLLIYFGPTDMSKLALLFLGCIFFLIALILDDVLAVPKELIESSQTMGASHWHILTKIVLPAAAPRILDSMRNMIAVSWTYLVIAEIVAATDGIGAVMMRASRFLHVETIMAGILTIGILGVITDLLFRFAGRMLFPYNRLQR
jgi:NitT/TauT family transport system permease protein